MVECHKQTYPEQVELFAMTQHFRAFFARNFFVWRIFGHWYPKEPKNGPSSNKVVAVILNVSFLFFWTTQFMYLTGGVENLIVLTDIVTVGIIFFLATLKGALMIYNTERMERLLRMVDDMEESTKGSAEEEAIVVATVPIMRLNWSIISVCGAVCATTQFLKTMVVSENILMHPSYIKKPFYTIDNTALYYVVNLIQYGMALHTGILLGTMETVGPNLMLVLNAYLKILNQRLMGLAWNTTNAETIRRMRECVEFHKVCIK